MRRVLLQKIRIAAKCPASWDEMPGDDHVRRCGECGLNVYNVSWMSEEEMQQLLARTSGRQCVRLFRRVDGTVMTQDCPSGRHEVHAQLARVGTRFGLLFGLVAGTAALPTIVTHHHTLPDWMQSRLFASAAPPAPSPMLPAPPPSPWTPPAPGTYAVTVTSQSPDQQFGDGDDVTFLQ
jgi:hypothetical protein